MVWSILTIMLSLSEHITDPWLSFKACANESHQNDSECGNVDDVDDVDNFDDVYCGCSSSRFSSGTQGVHLFSSARQLF
jgi:hypothetical protein